MIDKLPYQLTAGVTATREGLVVDRGVEIPYNATMTWYATWIDNVVIIEWPDAAERLRYREGGPWSHTHPWDDDIMCGNTHGDYGPDLEDGGIALHRLAAILCDDAEAFRVLWWCLHNLVVLQESEDEN